MLAADCLPVALGDAGAVAMLHAGWRGLAAGVLESGVAALRELGGSERIVAVIGPGAGACCYEVGAEVHAAFGGAHRHGDRIDLRAIARERLLAAGVAEVLDAAVCTICDERFFSHRREGARAGRQGGVAWRELISDVERRARSREPGADRRGARGGGVEGARRASRSAPPEGRGARGRQVPRRR